MVDLNTLIPSNSSLQLTFAVAINDSGEIAGFGVPPGCAPKDVGICGHAYVLVPCGGDHADDEGCQDANSGMSISSRATAASIAEHPAMTPSDPSTGLRPGEMLERFRARWAGRYHIALPGAPRN
jgi:hypothetical protein